MKTIDQRDITITRELAYDIIKYAEYYAPPFRSWLDSFIVKNFPESEIDTKEKFEELLTKLSNEQIEKILLRME